MGFELETTGFTLPELDILMTASGESESSNGDQVEEELAPPEVPVSVLGDLWELGKHRVLCGDSAKSDSYQAVLSGELANVIVADCPGNIPIEGSISGLGKKKHQNFIGSVAHLNNGNAASLLHVQTIVGVFEPSRFYRGWHGGGLLPLAKYTGGCSDASEGAMLQPEGRDGPRVTAAFGS